MSKITLNKLTLKNFKGIKSMTIDFSNFTNIKGDNATGKTTIFDGFTWLLFDKDSNDRQSFEIKTLDSNNKVIHGLDHEVSGILTINGKEVKLTKIFKEKWTKKKGEAERLLTGHETLYYIDEVPVKQSEYKDRISSIISEQLFKLISNPLYFSMNMKWQDRRNEILDIIGDISSERIINCKRELQPLENLLKDFNIDTLKKSIAARKRKLNEDIKSIPYRIDEINNSITEYDFEALQDELMEQELYIREIEEKILESSKTSKEALEDRTRVYDLKEKLGEMEFKATAKAQLPLKGLYAELSEGEKEISRLESLLSKGSYILENKEKEAVEIKKELEKLRDRWAIINGETIEISEESFICPTCNRPLESNHIEAKREELTNNFLTDKIKRLNEINSTGKSRKERLSALEGDIEKLKEERDFYNSKLEELYPKITALQGSIKDFMPEINLEANEEYVQVTTELKELEIKLSKSALQSQESNKGEINSLKNKKLQLTKDLDEVKKKLGAKEQNEKFRARINELSQEEKKLAESIAQLERQEFLCEEYIKTKVELLEDSINNRFKLVRFKLFNTLVNGAVEECCEALINGVPFSNANTASQINGGLDIINALGDYYDVQAPIFIDNRESVNEILDCKAQIINLIVSNDKALVVENINRVGVLKDANNSSVFEETDFKPLTINSCEKDIIDGLQTFDYRKRSALLLNAEGPDF